VIGRCQKRRELSECKFSLSLRTRSSDFVLLLVRFVCHLFYIATTVTVVLCIGPDGNFVDFVPQNHFVGVVVISVQFSSLSVT